MDPTTRGSLMCGLCMARSQLAKPGLPRFPPDSLSLFFCPRHQPGFPLDSSKSALSYEGEGANNALTGPGGTTQDFLQ